MTRTPIILIAGILMGACTENTSAKLYGGTMHVNLPCGQKLTEITWKEEDLWFASRPMRSGEVPEVTTFQEKSTFGFIEGAVVVKECQK